MDKENIQGTSRCPQIQTILASGTFSQTYPLQPSLYTPTYPYHSTEIYYKPKEGRIKALIVFGKGKLRHLSEL